MANWCSSADNLNASSSWINSVSNNPWSSKLTGVYFLTQEFQRITIRYMPVKEKDVAL